MIDPTLALIVPEKVSVRQGIRKDIEEYFLKNEVMPPISYNTLVVHADALIESKQWEPQYRAYIMVCCGNAVWRKVIGAIPFNRRVFLLPQCLSNSNNCKAQHDELGLLCNECGNCSISGFLREAENLGYVALVTEGTTITTKLIESGKVDAVIGIGCMESLQKMFASVSKYSIPGIGIPLLTCGCKDTLADADWIKHEIYYSYENPSFRLLNLNHIKNKTSSIFGEEQLSRMLGPSKNKTEKIALETLLSGGQRIRSFLAMLTYDTFCEQSDPAVFQRLALSVECFHKASLIHDDIEDNDDTRYGKETVHAKYGIPIAINIGDFLIGEGYRLITECSVSPEIIRDGMKVISQGHKNLTIGQGAELEAIKLKKILPLIEMIEVFENKTSAAFNVSLLLGATVGGADTDTLQRLDCFSNFIGIAYQIKDDLSDYQGDKGDISIRKFSVLLSILAEKLQGTEKNILQNAFEKNNNELIYRLIEDYKIPKETEILLMDYIQKSKSCLDNFPNLGLKLALHEILGKIFKDYL